MQRCPWGSERQDGPAESGEGPAQSPLWPGCFDPSTSAPGWCSSPDGTPAPRTHLHKAEGEIPSFKI